MQTNPPSSPDDPDPQSSFPVAEVQPQDNDAATPTQPGSPGPSPSTPRDPEAVAAVKRERYRVRFNSNASATKPLINPFFRGSDEGPSEAGPSAHLPIPRPRPSVLRTSSENSIPTTDNFEPDPKSEKAISAVAAQERARQVADNLRREKGSTTWDSRPSYDSQFSADTNESELLPGNDIPLGHLGHQDNSQQNLTNPQFDQHQEYEQDEEARENHREQAFHLVQSHSCRFKKEMTHEEDNGESSEPKHEAHPVPREVNDGSWDGVYNVPPPQHYRGSVLSQLLQLYKPQTDAMGGHTRNWSSSTLAPTQDEETGQSTKGSGSAGSGGTTPNRKKWYEQNRSQETLANLIEASTRLANPNMPPPDAGKTSPGRKWARPMHKRRTSSNSRMSAFIQKEEARITVHIAETLCRQEYIIKLCRALMLYGAPTHRLEEYLSMTARVLEIDGQFLYLPGCMVISFDDRSTHTTEVRMVRSNQGIDLGKLKDVHRVYKEVMHDVIGVEEGTERLDALMNAPDKFNAWLRVLIFGLTSASCSPFSFKARLIDLPLIFCLGCLVGFLQLIVSPKSKLYSNVFEVSAVVIVSFLARAFASISGGNLFCFSALAQGGIVMLLPGYLVLCSALELQSRAIVPGSIRIVYAIVYSLLLGFGITVGASLWGLFDNNPVSETKCSEPLDPYVAFVFVPPFIICISILYQAKWRQMPVMTVIAFAGYIVNFFSTRKFAASPQIANTLGALTVGLLANLYSRIRHGVAAATLIPAIFTQVPGGLASTGGLLSGISTANLLTGGNSTEGGSDAQFTQADQNQVNAVVFNVAASMIQIAIGIAVGLFISALIIYPLGKRRSGLFSF